MARSNHAKIWNLASRETVRLADARGTTLQVVRGALWITLQDDTRDVVLEAGEAFTVDRDGLTLAEAQQPTKVRVRVPGGLGRRLAARIAARSASWFAALAAVPSQRRWAPYL